ncbi:MAG: MFS transporter [Candidatus Limnocylindrales bacterium]
MNILRAYRQLLGNGPLTRLLAGEFVSAIGDWLYLVALLIVVYRAETSPLVLGIVGAARVLPYVVLSVPAGIVADRFDRRLVLLVTDIARGLIMIVIALLVAFDGPLLAIVSLTILATCFSTFFNPAIGAYLPRLVRDETELGPANSAWASLDSLAFVIGPAIGGLLIAVGGLTLAFVLNAVSFGVVAVVLWRLPSAVAKGPRAPDGEAAPEPSVGPGETATSAESSAPAESGAPPEPPLAEAGAAGLRTAARPLSGLLLIDVVTGAVFGGLSVLTVVLAIDVLVAGEAATGTLNAAIGVGGLIGAAGAGALVLRRSLAAPLVGGGLALAAGVAVLGFLHDLGLAALALVVVSAGSLVVEVISLTLLQRSVPDRARGRAIGTLETGGVAAYALGSLLLPVAEGQVGMAPVLLACGVAVVGAIVGGALIIGPHASAAPTLSPAAARFTTLAVFAGLPPSRLEGAAAQLRPLSVPSAAAVIRQGDPADLLYFIVDGTFDVTQADPAGGPARHLRTMGPGELFGEIGLLARSPRTATVTAATDAHLLALDGAAFLELVGSGPGLTSRLLDLHRGVMSSPGGSNAG